MVGVSKIPDRLLGIGVLILGAAVFLPSVLGVSYNDLDVTFRLRTGKADISFSTVRDFTQITVASNAVIFDGVSFGIQKAPASGANLLTTITTWNPSTPSGTAIAFTGAALLTTHDIYFNVSGLQALTYRILVNDVEQGTDEGPAISFLWSNWNAQQDIVFSAIAASSEDPPPDDGGYIFRPITPFLYSIRPFSAIVDFIGPKQPGQVSGETWSWSFGDGTVGFSKNASHEYAISGLTQFYVVTLTHCVAAQCATSIQDVTLVNWPLMSIVIGGSAAVVVVLAVMVRSGILGSALKRAVRSGGDIRVRREIPKLNQRRIRAAKKAVRNIVKRQGRKIQIRK